MYSNCTLNPLSSQPTLHLKLGTCTWTVEWKENHGILHQGRIQDLSEGWGQDFLGTKKLIIRNKKSCRRRNFLLTKKTQKESKLMTKD